MWTSRASTCFTCTVMAVFEDFGFCPKGEISRFFADDWATYGGDVVVNPHGGLLSEGYIHGMNRHYEAVRKLHSAADQRQVPGPEVTRRPPGRAFRWRRGHTGPTGDSQPSGQRFAGPVPTPQQVSDVDSEPF